MRVSIQSDVGGDKSPKLLTSSPDSPRVIVKSGGAGGLDWIQLSNSSPLPFLCESIQHQLRVTRTSNKLKLKLKRKKESCVFFSLFLLIFISSCFFFFFWFLFWASVPSIVDGQNIWLFCPATLSTLNSLFLFFYFIFSCEKDRRRLSRTQFNLPWLLLPLVSLLFLYNHFGCTRKSGSTFLGRPFKLIARVTQSTGKDKRTDRKRKKLFQLTLRRRNGTGLCNHDVISKPNAFITARQIFSFSFELS